MHVGGDTGAIGWLMQLHAASPVAERAHDGVDGVVEGEEHGQEPDQEGCTAADRFSAAAHATSADEGALTGSMYGCSPTGRRDGSLIHRGLWCVRMSFSHCIHQLVIV